MLTTRITLKTGRLSSPVRLSEAQFCKIANHPLQRDQWVLATTVRHRRHKAPQGECRYCDEQRNEETDYHPSHDASPNCESGKHNHCSCDTCF